jgi:hypothetical protein
MMDVNWLPIGLQPERGQKAARIRSSVPEPYLHSRTASEGQIQWQGLPDSEMKDPDHLAELKYLYLKLRVQGVSVPGLRQ